MSDSIGPGIIPLTRTCVVAMFFVGKQVTACVPLATYGNAHCCVLQPFVLDGVHVLYVACDFKLAEPSRAAGTATIPCAI